MNAAHLHLILNHLPVIGSWFGLAFLVVAMIRRNDTLMSSALLIFIFTALIAIPTLLTGDPAEHLIRDLPGVTRAYIHVHEEAAQMAFLVLEILGVIAIVGLIMHKRGMRLPWWLKALLLIGALMGSAAMVRVAELGGEIRHTEIRGSDTVAAPSQMPPPGGPDLR